jgi:hypothetical protein
VIVPNGNFVWIEAAVIFDVRLIQKKGIGDGDKIKIFLSTV